MVKKISRVPFEQLSPESTGVIGLYSQPISYVDLEEEVELETWDCTGNVVKPWQSRQQALDRGIKSWSNPITGPIYIKGADPGDTLLVEILEIKLSDNGFTSISQGVTPLNLYIEQSKTRFCEVIGSHIHFINEKGHDIIIDSEPFIGTIGVSPSSEAVSTITPGNHGGNMDCIDIHEGSLLMLPVSRPGALFSLGDVHAVQGDGEISGTA